MTYLQHTASQTGDAGWCIHGVQYGPNWRCGSCTGPSALAPIIVSTGSYTDAQPVITRADVDKIIRLLESIEYQLRTRR
jgi:hypothetical protein